ILSLFYPIKLDGLPETSKELSLLEAGIDQRTILIRSISSILSGISVMVAFISLMQSRVSDITDKRMQVMPYPAYALRNKLAEEGHSFTLGLKNEDPRSAVHVTTQFSLLIRNIGLASLIDYEITKVRLHSYSEQ